MSARFLLTLALLPAVVALRASPAQQAAFVRDTDGLRVEIRARGGRVEIVSRWSHVGDPILLVDRDTIVGSPGPRNSLAYPGRTVRLFLPPDTAYRFVRWAMQELAAPDSVLSSKDRGSRLTLAPMGFAMTGAVANRVQTGPDKPSGYYVAFQSCRGERIAMVTSRENWRSIIDGLRTAADSARRRPGAARHEVYRAPTSKTYAIDEISCPARPYVGNALVTLDSGADFLSGSRMVALDLLVDSGGMVVTDQVRRVEGDGALFTAAVRAVRTWRFVPALDTDRRPIAERARLLVIDRSPISREDSLQVFARARAAGAQFVTVAARERAAGTRTITSADGARRVHMLTFGHPAQIVFIPDLGGRAADWREVALALEPTLPSLSYDLRGHSESTRSRDADYSLDAQVADLRDVIDSTMVAWQIVVAVGSSCAIAVEYARRFPGRVSALVLIAPNGADDAHGVVPTVSHAYASTTTRYRVDYATDPAFYPSLLGDDKSLLRTGLLNRLRAVPPDVIAESLESLRDYDVVSAVGGYPGRTYVLLAWKTSGSGYTAGGPLPMEWLRTGARDTSRVVISRAGVGIAPHVLEPRALTKWLAGVLADLGAR